MSVPICLLCLWPLRPHSRCALTFHPPSHGPQLGQWRLRLHYFLGGCGIKLSFLAKRVPARFCVPAEGMRLTSEVRSSFFRPQDGTFCHCLQNTPCPIFHLQVPKVLPSLPPTTQACSSLSACFCSPKCEVLSLALQAEGPTTPTASALRG